MFFKLLTKKSLLWCRRKRLMWRLYFSKKTRSKLSKLEHALFLLRLVDNTALLEHYRPKHGLTIKLTVSDQYYSNTLEGLLNALQVIIDDKYLPQGVSFSKGFEYSTTLDDYLINASGYPVALQECKATLQKTLEGFEKHLYLQRENGSNRVSRDYYIRKLTSISTDVLLLAEVIVSIASKKHV